MNAPSLEIPIKRWLRRLWVAMVGSLIVLIGIALLVLPGPGVLTIAAGLSLLSTEFDCARRYLHWCKSRTGRLGRYLARAAARRD